MLARFFIERPVFAWVISIVITGFGTAAYFTLPIAQYPEITPPTVQVSCVYPGASADIVRDTVAAPIEQQVNGVEDMLYMSSQSANDGSYTLTVTFKLGTELNMAQVLVQNRVSLALPTLPQIVQASGVTTKKKSPSILLVVNLYSDTNPDSKKPYFDQLFLSNYGTIQIKDELARLDGVGDATFLGQQDYSMRVWVDPQKLATRNLTAGDVVKAVQEQNVQVAAGALGRPPTPKGLDFQYTLNTQGRLTEADQFDKIVIKTGAGTDSVFVRDVGASDLGSKNMDTQCALDGQPSVGLAIFQLPGSNALQTADRVRAKMKELKERFPKGVEYAIVYDTTPFINESVHAVFHTLIEAVILVAIVVLLFLQDWKAMILPMIDVPVSLIGTLAIMTLMGFTLNNLTLFGLVLAIGIVVDDAIIVLENVERWIGRGLPPKEATIKAMGEITGPIIAMTLVLCSVFLPSALIPGISGQFYRQFALTISASMAISAINAMTLTPSRAVTVFASEAKADGQSPGHVVHHEREALPWWGTAALLGWLAATLGEKFLAGPLGLAAVDAAHGGEAEAGFAAWRTWLLWGGFFVAGAVVGWFVAKPLNRVLAVFFKAFNRVFDRITEIYGWTVGKMLRLSFIVLAVYGGLLGLTLFGLARTPIGFIPSQDKGYLIVDIQLPDSASLERTVDVVRKIDKIASETDGVAHRVAVPGQSFIANAISSNFAGMFFVLKPFEERRGAALNSDAIAGKLRKRMREEILEARVSIFGPPAVDGLGNAGGFKLMVEDRGDAGLATLQGQADNLAAKANAKPGLVGVFNSFRASTPQLYLDIDRNKCKTMGIALSDVFNTLQVYLGGYYVNDFNKFGRTWQVNVQADAKYRLDTEDVKDLRVRNADGEMVPLGAVARIYDIAGPVAITRYNMYTAAPINGGSLPGVSSGQVIKTMEQTAKEELAKSMAFEWTEITFLQLQAGSTAIFAFLGAVILVFLVLSAQYESWSMPLAVLLVVPMCLLSSVAGIQIARMDINIFVQVGFVVLIGLASKNAILIVEFAREQRHAGKPAWEAAVDACKLRLRPIVMTSFAFILGVVPLVISTGAGAEMRRTLGVAVFSGMLGVTFFGIFLTPVFFYVIDRWTTRGTR